MPGDGIGPEVTREAVKVLRTLTDLGIGQFDIARFPYGGQEYRKTGIALPDEVIEEFTKNYDAILLGALGDPNAPDNSYVRRILLGLRSGLDLFIGYRPVYVIHPELHQLHQMEPAQINFTIFRDIAEGFAINLGGVRETQRDRTIAIQESLHTREGITRVIRSAFEFADQQGLKKVTLTDKSNILRHTHTLWSEVFHTISQEFADKISTHMNVDSFLYEVIRNPGKFQVVVTLDLFGDVLSEFCAALQGGVGVAGTSYWNPGSIGLFRPVHGPAPGAAGKNISNPFGAIECIRQMLLFFNRTKTAQLIQDSLHHCVEHRLVTPDLGGSLGTGEVGDYVCQTVERLYTESQREVSA